MIILGIEPGLAIVGYGIIEKTKFGVKVIDYGVINTPKEAGQDCGISVRFDEKSLAIVKKCLTTKPFRAFVGFFRITY